MKIYTKTGDKGETGLFGGKRVPKSSSYIQAYGEVDELNAWMGMATSVCEDSDLLQDLTQIQHDLHCLCADLSTPMDSSIQVDRLAEKRFEALEVKIDLYEKELEPLENFILAGGSELSSRLHVARTVCRRSERAVLTHSHSHEINANTVIYLNRLSDFLFVLARVANRRSHIGDIPWDKDH